MIAVLAGLKCYSQIWSNGEDATYVIGARTFTTTASLGATDSTFYFPLGATITTADPKHKFLYVADVAGSRVLRFNYPISGNMPRANLVIGQPNFSTTVSSGNTNGMDSPSGLTVDTVSGTLWIADADNNRVLRYDSAHKLTANYPAADQVLGQSSFSSSSYAVTQNGFKLFPGLCGNLLYYDHSTGSLWVSDNGNYRVMRFDNAKTKTNGANADALLGQTNYTASAYGLTQSKFNRPDAITMIGSSLFLSDPVQNRVLRFDNVYSKPNGGPADAVYGQINFVSNYSGVSATSLYTPTGLTTDGTKLYISESSNDRVLIFNSPLTNTVASNVLLTPNFTTTGYPNINASSAGTVTSLYIDPVYKQLLVTDLSEGRIMVFNGCGLPLISGSPFYCTGSPSITLNASGASTYSWSTGATGPSITVAPTMSTQYSLSATFTTGCVISTAASFTVGVVAGPTVVASSSSGTTCAGQSCTLSASGASTYSWSTGATTSVTVVSPTVSTVYSVKGSSGVCSVTPTLALTVIPNPTITASCYPSLICTGHSSTLIAGGASTYSWSSGATTQTAVTSPTTSTIFTVTGVSSGCTSTKTVGLGVYTTPTVAIISSASGSLCSGQTLILSATGAASYSWSTGQTAASITVSPASSAVYAVTGTSTICSDTASVGFTVYPSPTVSANSSGSVICAGQSSTLTCSGASTYSWNTGASVASVVVSPSVSTTYTVSGTNASGCTSSVTITQTVSLCTGIPSLASKEEPAFIYPNPNNGMFTVAVRDRGATVKVEIINSIGEVILEQQLGGELYKVDMTGVAAGIYMLRLSEYGHLIYRSGIVKQSP